VLRLVSDHLAATAQFTVAATSRIRRRISGPKYTQ
jgi:hypothetical protein